MINRKNLSWWRSILLGLICIALLLSGALSWISITGGTVIGCSGGGSCDEILNGSWSRIAGVVPVSVLALGLYAVLLIVFLRLCRAVNGSSRQLICSILLVISGAIIGAAAWFTYIQLRIIHSFCVYCMITHAIGLLIAILTIYASLITGILCSRKNLFMWVSLGGVMAVLFASLQICLMPDAVGQKIVQENRALEITDQAIPMIGSSDASNVIVLLFDYKCSHCQKIHFILKQTVQRYDKKLAFALYPSPLDSSCNQYVLYEGEGAEECCELAEIGLAVWLTDRDAYSRFDDWMFSFDTGSRWLPRSVEASKRKAMELVGQSRFEDAMNDPFIKAHISDAVGFFGRTMHQGKGSVPKMIYGNSWIVPEAYSVDDMIYLLQKTFGIDLP